MLTHLPVNGNGGWAVDEAANAFEADVEVAEPARAYEV